MTPSSLDDVARCPSTCRVLMLCAVSVMLLPIESEIHPLSLHTVAHFNTFTSLSLGALIIYVYTHTDTHATYNPLCIVRVHSRYYNVHTELVVCSAHGRVARERGRLVIYMGPSNVVFKSFDARSGQLPHLASSHPLPSPTTHLS